MATKPAINELKVQKIVRALTANDELQAAIKNITLDANWKAEVVQALELQNQKSMIEVQQGVEAFKQERLENKISTKKLREILNDNEDKDR